MERLMQYIWQYRLYPTAEMVTVDGKRVEILDPGLLNRDAGPDFFNAKITIGGQEWVGNIEIHVRASDWKRHGHDTDPAYDSVILHVVEKDDAQIRRADGNVIPQLVMTCSHDFSARYQDMVNNPARELPCGPELPKIPQINISDWFTSLAYERLYQKCDRIERLLTQYNGNWIEVIYVVLARALGFSTNSEPFELLAKSTPLKHMLHYSDSPEQIEAMLFGQSGLIDKAHAGDDEYAEMLRHEYEFMKVKFGLRPSSNIVWKMARMRPQNFPHRRIATLAAMVTKHFALGNKILAIKNEEEARALFDINLRGYWARHFNFSPTTVPTGKALSHSSITVLLINVVAPILYAYGTYTGDSTRQEIAISLLQSLKPERNSIIDIYERAGLKATDAFTTQAMIQLRREYCQQRKCLFCRIGHKLLSSKVKP